ncbi:MAG: Nitroreductase [Chloroflexi bacterium]|nr:MAG: Nitroreductase [Chloroflexota bacterium]
MDVDQAIRQRRSVGTFDDRPITREVVARLIDAAAWAPTHHLTQPWRFVVLAGGARAALADAVAAADPVTGVARAAHKKLGRAPVCVIVSHGVPENVDAMTEREDYAACAAAIQNLMLSAQAIGLASKWSTGALAESSSAKAYLGLDPNDRIVGYVYLGYATGQAPSGERDAPIIDWRGL